MLLVLVLLASCLYGADLLDNPAIHYNYAPVHDPVARLDPSKIKADLRSVLDALHVPVESQIAVFSKTSLQSPLIGPNNPRTIFFNDSVAVGWMKGGFIEIAALDPRQGVQFYTLDPHASGRPHVSKKAGIACAAMWAKRRWTYPARWSAAPTRRRMDRPC